MTIDLEKLTGLLAHTALNEKLPKEFRPLVSQMALLAKYVGELEAKVDAHAQANDTHIAELANLMLLLRKNGGAPAGASAAAPVERTDAPQVDADPEEDLAKAMAEQVLRETAAEAAAAAPAEPVVAPVVPPRKPGNGKAVEGAAS